MGRIASTTPPADAVIPNRHVKAPAVGTQIPSHFGHCFGCGELHESGLHLVAIAGSGLDLTGKFTVTDKHQGAPGLAHGGLLSLAFDEALGKLMWLIRTPAVTGRLDSPTGEIAVKAEALFISVPMEHFIKNLTEQYKDHLVEHPELMAFVDPDFDINP